MASGALDDMVGGPRDDIQAELDRMGAGSGVEAELERLKGELGQGGAPRQIEGAGAAADGVADSSRKLRLRTASAGFARGTAAGG